jgi:hypothetical protein
MRIQLELSEDRVHELKALMEQVGVETYKDLFNNALSLFEWAIQEAEKGRTLASIDEQAGKYRELAMPVIDRIVNRSGLIRTVNGTARSPSPR